MTLETGRVRTEHAEFLLALAGDDRFRLDGDFKHAKPVTNNRNWIARLFRQSDNDWLLMMDDDVVPHGNPLDYIGRDLDIVVFPCPIYQFDEGALVWNVRFSDRGEEQGSRKYKPSRGLGEIAAGGTGAILLARRVLEHPDLLHAFQEEKAEDGVSTFGHDLYFVERARRAGFKAWVAWDCPCSHWAEVDLFKIYAMMAAREADREKK